jgi:nucleoside-diphosphate-sugar epimerase
MRIAVVGGAGYIGSRLCEKLFDYGHQIVCIVRNKSVISHSRYEIIEYDFLVNESYSNLFEYFKNPDVVIDAAWERLDDYSHESHIGDILQKHCDMVENLINNGLTRITVLGTCLEYGQEGEMRENTETLPKINYAKGKDLYKSTLFKLKLERRFEVQWLRLFYHYGPQQKESSIFSQLLLADKKNQIFNMSCGEQERDYLHIDQVIEYVSYISVNCQDVGIVNICSNKPVKIKILVNTWIKKYGLNVQVNLCHYPYSIYEPFKFWGSNKKLIKLISKKNKRCLL